MADEVYRRNEDELSSGGVKGGVRAKAKTTLREIERYSVKGVNGKGQRQRA